MKERFQEKRCEKDWRIPIKEALMKEKKNDRFENTEGIYPGERRIVPHDAGRNTIKMCGARGSPKKIEGSA